MKKYLILTAVFFLIYPLYGKRITHLKNVRYYSYPEYTRIVLDLSGERAVREKVLPGDIYRLYFDLESTVLHRKYPAEKKKEIPVNKGNLLKIRIGKRNKRTIRVVFDFRYIKNVHKFYLTSPFRIVFDVHKGKQGKEDNSSVITKPAEKVDSTFSVARQLGLGVRKIVIDPGHGGKDPGAVNRRLRIYEKTLTLDIAKRLKKYFQSDRKYEVILTRDKDKYLSLEERTAIANSKRCDLFISIHINSAPRKAARGIETFYLSMTQDPGAIRVAAKENAMSTKSIAQMKSIVNKIVKNTKVSESRLLSKYIQKELVRKMKTNYKNILDLGVKKAPFYVLVGAQMPCSLAEVSFLSNYQEAKRLKKVSYRESIARGLYKGILRYIDSLSKSVKK